MAKNKSKQKSSPTKTIDSQSKVASSPKWENRKWHLIILGILSVLLYANTLTHEYTQDDAIVIYDNEFTTAGFEGIPGLLKYDTFRGFFKTEGKDKLVSGGRYRPLTPIMFAIEYQFFGRSPFIGHLISVLWYAILVMVLYLTLERLFLKYDTSSQWRYMILAACILFAIHPVHTEAIANIKGRDETISLLGSLLALYYVIKAFDSSSRKHLILSGLFFFLALMSKENTITYLAIIPLALYIFRKASIGKSIMYTLPALAGTILFLLIRYAVIGFDLGGTPMELMNNPFLVWTGDGYSALSKFESLPTMIYCLGKYIGLLLFPHPLTHDYYPRHIDIMSWSDMTVILSMVLYFTLSIFAIWKLKSRSVIAFCIIYFLATISIVSNIVFPIGTNMSERFLFMPSVGFALMLAYIGWKNYDKYPLIIKGLFVIVVIAFTTKTITRNTVWKNDYTLFTTDVHTSTRSAKLLNAAGGTKVTRASKMDDSPLKTRLLNEATNHLDKALEIHPTYKNAMLLNGNAHFYKNDFDGAIKNYEKIISLYPNDKDGVKNLAVALRDGGRYYGEQKNDITKAKQYLSRSLNLVPDDIETIRLMGITNGVGGNHREAIKYFNKVIELQPDVASGYVNLYNAYMLYGDEEAARINYEKAISLDPKAFERK